MLASYPGMFDRFTTLPVNRFPHQLAPDVLNNMLRNPSFCYFAPLLVFLLTPFINKPNSSRDLIIFKISSISLLEIITVVHCAKPE